jgi:hypothetical protein
VTEEAGMRLMMRERKKLTAIQACRYQEASKKEKGKILDELPQRRILQDICLICVEQAWQEAEGGQEEGIGGRCKEELGRDFPKNCVTNQNNHILLEDHPTLSFFACRPTEEYAPS